VRNIEREGEKRGRKGMVEVGRRKDKRRRR